MTNYVATFKIKVNYLQFVIMNSGRYIFTQLYDFLPRLQFERYVAKYEVNKYVNLINKGNIILTQVSDLEIKPLEHIFGVPRVVCRFG